MAKLVFAMNQSLDGYVEHTKFSPSPALFRHFIEHARGLAGLVCGRGMYKVMRTTRRPPIVTAQRSQNRLPVRSSRPAKPTRRFFPASC